MILHQHARAGAQQEQFSATLSFRRSEIERLVLLVEKLQRMLFGAKSEKVPRQMEQIELKLEELQAASAVEEIGVTVLLIGRCLRSPLRVLTSNIFRVRFIRTFCITAVALTAVTNYAAWAKTWSRRWRTSGQASESFVRYVPS